MCSWYAFLSLFLSFFLLLSFLFFFFNDPAPPEIYPLPLHDALPIFRIPPLVIAAEDDPFVPAEPFRNSKVTGNPHIHLAICQHGGHCAFVGPASGDDDEIGRAHV